MPPLSVKPSLFGRATAVLKDHIELTAEFDLLRALATHLMEGRTIAMIDTASLLEAFSEAARAHFAAEESDGYFSTLVDDCPEFTERIDRLKGEHAEMIRTMERLVELVNARTANRELGSELRQFVDRFQMHERAENTILQEFFLRDHGGRD